MTVLGRLKYMYVGSTDAAKDIAHWTSLGAEPEWDHTAFGTRVAGFRLAAGPLWIVAGHRRPGVLPVFVVPDVESLRRNLEAMGWGPREGPVEIPDGPCYLYEDPSGNEIAIVGEVRPEAEEHLRQGMEPHDGRPDVRGGPMQTGRSGAEEMRRAGDAQNTVHFTGRASS